MKAEKYGMPISEADAFVACQVQITQDRKLYEDLHLLHAVQVGPSLRAALDGIGSAPPAAEPAPVAVPVPAVAPVQQLAAPVRPVAPDLPFDLRASLGIG